MAHAVTAGSHGVTKPAGRINIGVAALLLLATATITRWRLFGNPMVDIDEDFYLLVGSRMLHGAVPFVDIFDRKPIGLFLIYAFARLLGGDGVIEYQLLALASVVATALVIFVVARRVSNDAGGLAAGVLYLLFLTISGGESGQSPVFYNLPVAGAMAILFFARKLPSTQGGDLRWPGVAAMALIGLALQIKYTVIFEGLFAGVVLLGMARARGRALGPLALDATLWVGCALLPTVAAAAAYAAIGHLQEWIFANIGSIFLRAPEAAPLLLPRLLARTKTMAFFLLAIILRRWLGVRSADPAVREDLRFLDAWAACALLGVVLFGTWFNHYALPLFVPFAITASPLATRRSGRGVLIAAILLAAGVGQRTISKNIAKRGDATVLAGAANAVRGHRGCVFVYEEMISLYEATGSCFITTRIFPSHLWQQREAPAIGIDQLAELRRIMALRPDRIVTMEPIWVPDANPASLAIVYAVLRRDYVPLWRHHLSTADYVVYGLRPGAGGRVSAPSAPAP